MKKDITIFAAMLFFLSCVAVFIYVGHYIGMYTVAAIRGTDMTRHQDLVEKFTNASVLSVLSFFFTGGLLVALKQGEQE